MTTAPGSSAGRPTGLLHGYYIEHHRGDAPLTPGRALSEASHVEVLRHPQHETQAFLLALWPDKTTYLQGWLRAGLEAFLASAGVTARDEGRVWSRELEAELMNTAKHCPGKGWCTFRTHW